MKTRPRRGALRSLAALSIAAALVAAGCGNDDDSSSETTAAAVTETTSAVTETTAAAVTETTAAAVTETTAAAVTETTAAASSGTERELIIARDMDINSLDPDRAYCDTCQIYLAATYETLIGLDVQDLTKQLPRLATTWEGSPDNTKFTFTLDPNAKFSDGSAVEAKDVKWSWERLANLKGSAAYLMDGLASIETPEATSVVVTFSKPNSAFLPIVSATYMGVVNSDVATAEGAQNGAGADTADKAEPWFLKNSAGSGPFVLDSYTAGESLRLKRNDNYWGAKAAFPAVTIKQIKDSTAQLQALQQGEADIAMQISVDALAQLEGNDKVTAQTVDSYNYVYIALSPGAKGAENIADAKVRLAIKLAIDYDGMIETTVAGKGKKQASPIPNGFLGAASLTLPARDLDKAKSLLAEAGKADGFDLDAIYPKANVYGVDFDTMMQKVQQDLKEIKVNLKLQPVEFPQWSDTIRKQGIPLTAVYFAPDHTDSSQYVQYFGMIEGSSWAGRAGGGAAGKPVINAAEGPLLAKALADSGAQKEQDYTELGQAMIDDLVILTMVNPQLVLAHASDITNMHYSACCNLEIGQLGLK